MATFRVKSSIKLKIGTNSQSRTWLKGLGYKMDGGGREVVKERNWAEQEY